MGITYVDNNSGAAKPTNPAATPVPVTRGGIQYLDEGGSTKTGLAPIDEPTEPSSASGIKVPEPIRKLASAAYTPVRGTRAIGVGIEKLLQGIDLKKLLIPGGALDPNDLATISKNANDALQSSAAAAKPGYVPQPGEKLGAFAGESAGLAALTAPVAAAGAAAAPAISEALGIAPEAADAAANFGRAGVSGAIDAAQAAGLTAGQEAAEKGVVKPMDVAQNAAIAAGIPFIKPSYDAIKAGVKQLLPEIYQKTMNVPAKATKMLMENPDIMVQHKGLETDIEQRVGEVQKRIVDVRKAAGDALNAVKEKLGIATPLKDEIDKMAESGVETMNPQEVAQAFKDSGKIPEQARMKYLVDLRQKLDDNLNFASRATNVAPIGTKEEGVLRQMRKQINGQIEKLPGGTLLRDKEEAFHEIAGIYDDLQNKMSEPGKAADTLAKIFRGDLNGITNFRSRQVEQALQKLDEGQEKKVLEPLWKEMTAKYFNRYLGKGLGSYFVGQTGAAGAGYAALHANPIGAAVTLPITASLVSPKLAGLEIRGAQKISPYVSKFIDTINNPKLKQAIISAVVSKSGQGD